MKTPGSSVDGLTESISTNSAMFRSGHCYVKPRMSEHDNREKELEKLASLHERVAKLRSRLKTHEIDTYSAMGKFTDEGLSESADPAEPVSKEYT